MRRLVNLACALALAVLAAGLPAAVAVADEPKVADLAAVAEFDKPAYTTADTIQVKVTISNAGPDPAAKVVAGMVHGNAYFDLTGWGDLDFITGKGVRLEPGQSVEVTLSGRPNLTQIQPGVINFGFGALNWSTAEPTMDLDPANNDVFLEVPLSVARGSYAGTLYADRNANAAKDSGEELSGIAIKLTGGLPHAEHSATTDANGHFAFRDLPAGQYTRSFALPPGWAVPYETITIDGQEHPEVTIAARNTASVLVPTMRFTKDTYAVGEQAHLTVTVTNRGAVELSGITASCTGAGFGFELDSSAPGWGDLAYQGAGVTVGPQETKTFDVWSVVPQGAFTYGFANAYCIFNTVPPSDADPVVSVRARVPGGKGAVGGVLKNADGLGVANTKIVLSDELSHAVTARAITDANGRFVFRDVPAFNYEVSVVGPWKIVRGAEYGMQVLAGRERLDEFEIVVIPGAEQPDPDAPLATEPGTPQGGVAPPSTTRLANTGADMSDVAVTGLLAIALGVLLLLVRRRRAAQP